MAATLSIRGFAIVLCSTLAVACRESSSRPHPARSNPAGPAESASRAIALADIDKLETLGFFRYVRPADLPGARSWVREHNFAFAAEARRAYHIDAEDLAEGGALAVLGCLAPFLRHEGVPVDVTYAPVKLPAVGLQPARVGTVVLDADGWLSPDNRVKPCTNTPVARLRIAARRDGPLEEVIENRGRGLGDPYVVRIGSRSIVVVSQKDREDGSVQATKAMLGFLNELFASHGSRERAFGLYAGNDLAIAFATPEMAQVINLASSPGQELHEGLPRAHAASKL